MPNAIHRACVSPPLAGARLSLASQGVDAERYGPILAAHLKLKGLLDDAAAAALGRFDELRKMELCQGHVDQ